MLLLRRGIFLLDGLGYILAALCTMLPGPRRTRPAKTAEARP